MSTTTYVFLWRNKRKYPYFWLEKMGPSLDLCNGMCGQRRPRSASQSVQDIRNTVTFYRLYRKTTRS